MRRSVTWLTQRDACRRHAPSARRADAITDSARRPARTRRAAAGHEGPITALEALPYETIIPGHGLPRGNGLPSGRAVCAANREYLTVAATAFAEATGPEDLNKRLEAAFHSPMLTKTARGDR